jgi:glucuronosyltransferase
VNVFGKLKQKVIWKYENETLPNKPDNVMISPWVPQRDILAHPNIKLFITHGGLLGTTEAIVEGVPVLGFPIFGDQKMNIRSASSRGYGASIPFDEITEENLFEVINELVNNPKYRNNAKIISDRFNDRPMTPQESVVYWTEYVVKHKGAAHLRAEARNFNFIESNLIDVYSAFLAIGVLILYVDYLIIKFLVRKCCGKSSKKVKKN